MVFALFNEGFSDEPGRGLILSIYLKDESFVLTQVTLDAGFPIIPAVINGLNFNGIYHLPSVDCIILVCGHLFRFINFY